MRKLEIALFAVTFTHFHYNVFERGCEAISGNFALFARNCLTSTFKYIVMQMRNGNCEKGFSTTKIENLTLFLIPLKCEGGEWP